MSDPQKYRKKPVVIEAMPSDNPTNWPNPFLADEIPFPRPEAVWLATENGLVVEVPILHGEAVSDGE